LICPKSNGFRESLPTCRLKLLDPCPVQRPTRTTHYSVFKDQLPPTAILNYTTDNRSRQPLFAVFSEKFLGAGASPLASGSGGVL